MPEYDDTNRGVVFTNDRKDKDSHPDMTGSINIEGVDYWLSCWWKTPKNGGNEFLSLSVKPKEDAPAPAQRGRQAAAPATPATRGRARPAPQPAAPASGSGFDDMLDDIPFAPPFARAAWSAI